MHDDKLLGVLQVLNKESGRFDGCDEKLIQASATHAGTAIERALLLEEARKSQELALELELEVLVRGGAVGERVDLHRVIDHQVARHQRVDLLGVAAEPLHRGAHRREVDDAGHAGEVLQHHAAGQEGDLHLARCLVAKARQRSHVVLGDNVAVEVAERTLMDKVAVSRAVTKLIKNGRIDREFADADKRRSILNLSEDGKKLHDEIAELALSFERDLLEGLSAEELGQLNGIMERLLARARLIGTP